MNGTTPRGSRNRGQMRKLFWRDFRDSLSFQMVVVPSVLALIGVGLGDAMHQPGWAAVVTLLAAVIGVFFFFGAWRRQLRVLHRSTLVDNDAGHRQYGGLVFAPSILRDGDEARARYESQIKRLAGAWHPKTVVLIVSTAAEQAGGVAIIKKLMEPDKISITQMPLPEEQHLRPTAILDTARKAIGLLGDPADVLVDITAGSSVLSVGLYEAAAESNANVGYLEEATPRLILESTLLPEDAG